MEEPLKRDAGCLVCQTWPQAFGAKHHPNRGVSSVAWQVARAVPPFQPVYFFFAQEAGVETSSCESNMWSEKGVTQEARASEDKRQEISAEGSPNSAWNPPELPKTTPELI